MTTINFGLGWQRALRGGVNRAQGLGHVQAGPPLDVGVGQARHGRPVALLAGSPLRVADLDLLIDPLGARGVLLRLEFDTSLPQPPLYLRRGSTK